MLTPCGGRGARRMISLLATTADFFFVPPLEYLSSYLKLSPDVGGITLLALVSGPSSSRCVAASDCG